MFDRLSSNLSSAFQRLTGRGVITEANVRDAVNDIRASLLDADVHLDLADRFVEETLSEALGRQVTKSLKPADELVGIVHDRLVAFMQAPEGAAPGIPKAPAGPTVIMMVGLQGTGKTTTAGKLAAYLKKRGRSVMLAAADLQRPAAVDQLRTVAEQVQKDLPGASRVMFYGEPERVAEYGKAVGVAVDVAKRALDLARRESIDTLIVDTAGRLHVNDALMDELERVKSAVRPHMTLLVVDAMTGQDAVTSSALFHKSLGVTGVVLSKFDSDARGGAALTARLVTGAPVLFMGVGEKLDALEEFHAQRVAGRILGMGDVVSLVEKARDEVSEEDAEKMAEKMAQGKMTLDDFLKQMRALRRMGPMKSLLGMLPGVGAALKDVNVDEKQLDRLEGMVHSMTPRERRDTALLNHSRRKRIARGAGVPVEDVSKLVKQFEAVSAFSKQMAGMGMFGQMKAMKEMRAAAAGELPGAGGAGAPGSAASFDALRAMAGGKGAPGMPGGFPGFPSRGSTHTASPKAKFKKRKK